PGQQAAQRSHVVSVEAETISKLEPPSDAAVTFVIAVLVDKPRAPFAAHRRVVAPRDEACVFDRYHRLIIVAIESPGLDLAFAAFSAMQQVMKRMQTVITPGADVTQRSLELLRRQQLHSAISIPSSATVQPAASTLRLSVEPSIKIGFVLLM